MSSRFPRVSIIIPTQNEVGNIDALVSRITLTGVDFEEIIFVDNNSCDGTIEAIEAQAKVGPVRIVRQTAEASGLSKAIMLGAKAACGELIVVMDADLSHPPEEIGRLLRPLSVGIADMVIGSRYVPGGGTGGWPVWRRLLSRTGSLLAFPLTDVHDSLSGFFAIRRDVFVRLSPPASGFKIVFEVITRARSELRICEIPFLFRDRVCGRSKMSLRVALRFFARWTVALFSRCSEAFQAKPLLGRQRPNRLVLCTTPLRSTVTPGAADAAVP